MKAIVLAFVLGITGCAAAKSTEVVVAPPVTTASIDRAPPRCDFTRSASLGTRARDLSSPSRVITLTAVADVLAESCSGPLATIASRLRAEHADTDAAIDAILARVLEPIVPASCLATDQNACPVPWELAGLFASEEEWAEDRFFPESERPHPAALPRGPVLALASAIVARDSSFTARSLAAHALFRRVE